MSINIARFTLLIFLLLPLFGCVSLSSHEIDPRKLTSITTHKEIVLTKTYTWVVLQKGSSSFKYVMSPGIYTAEFSDERGVYYRGPSKCVSVVSGTEERSSTYLREGGIIVSTRELGGLAIYLYKSSDLTMQSRESTVTTVNSPSKSLPYQVGGLIGGLAVDVAILINDGKIMVPDDQPNDGPLRSLINF